MARNVEVKARVVDTVGLLERARAIGDGAPRVLDQEDVFFGTPRGRLKLRVCEGRGQLIFYERPDDSGPKLSRYRVVDVSEPGPLRALLADALGETATVRKQRTLIMAGQTRLHVDRVEGLGDFMELEVVLRDDQGTEEGCAIARDLMRALGVGEGELVAGAYADLLGAGAAAPDGRGDGC